MTGAEFEQLARRRRSVRGFTAEPVPAATVRAILTDGRTSPSGANLQPGRFIALAGDDLAGLVRALQAAAEAGRPEVSEYSYFPEPMPAPLKRRQVEAGNALYRALGIERRDRAARRRQFALNFRFFDAPVGIVVSIDRAMGRGCYMDLGMSLSILLLAAEARGLATCGIGALATRGDVVHEALGLPRNELVVCGIALGFADPCHPANRVRTERLTLDRYADLRGFDD